LPDVHDRLAQHQVVHVDAESRAQSKGHRITTRVRRLAILVLPQVAVAKVLVHGDVVQTRADELVHLTTFNPDDLPLGHRGSRICRQLEVDLDHSLDRADLEGARMNFNVVADPGNRVLPGDGVHVRPRDAHQAAGERFGFGKNVVVADRLQFQAGRMDDGEIADIGNHFLLACRAELCFRLHSAHGERAHGAAHGTGVDGVIGFGLDRDRAGLGMNLASVDAGLDGVFRHGARRVEAHSNERAGNAGGVGVVDVEP
jgi:hypothetical protein